MWIFYKPQGLIVDIVLCFIVFTICQMAACSRVGAIPAIKPTGSVAATALFRQEISTPTRMVSIWPTPLLTATPIADIPKTEEQMEVLIDQLYKVDSRCKLDILNAKSISVQLPKIEFIKSSVLINSTNWWVSEMADNPSKDLRAFIACDPNFCQQKVFLENRDGSSIQEVNWSGRIPYRPISQVMWIGDNLLTFAHQTGPNDAVIAAVQVREKKFLFYWLVGHPCP
jgi:hypothetical protein